MDLLLILTYTAICIVIFKIFKIPLNKWTVPTAILGGIVLIGTLIMIMNYNHPYSEMSRRYFATTPIISAVNGRVIKVPVKANTMLKKGEILFEIDPVPFQHKLDSVSAQLKLAKEDLARATILTAKGAFTARDKEALQAKFDQLTAEEANLIYDLQQTTVRAPTDGYVTQVALRPGMMATSLPIRPLMVFINDEKHYYVGWFRQNSLLRLKAGDEAEITFEAIPGVIFSGKVKTVLSALADGQVSASGELIDADKSPNTGRIPVVIDVTDPNFANYENLLPGGADGQTAVYTEHFHHVAIMRKVLLRMTAWMHYLFPFH